MSTFLSKIMDSAQDVRVSDSNERLNEYIQGVLRKSDLESFVAVAPRRDGYRIYVGEDMENPFAYVDVYLDGESLVVEGSSKRHLSDAEMGDLARFLGINGKEAGEKLNRFRKFVDLLRSESGKSVDDLKDAKVSDSGNKSWPEEYREKLHAVPVPEKRGRLTEQEEQDIMDRRNGIAVSSVTQLLNSMGYDAKGEEMDITVRGNEKSAEIRVGGLHNSDGFLAINVEGGRTEYFDITDAESWINYLRTALGGFVKDSGAEGIVENDTEGVELSEEEKLGGKFPSDDELLDMLRADASPKMLSRVANILKAQQRTSLKDGNTEVMAIAEYPNGALVYSFKQKAWQEAVKDSCKKVKDSDDASYKEELRTIYESYEDGSIMGAELEEELERFVDDNDIPSDMVSEIYERIDEFTIARKHASRDGGRTPDGRDEFHSWFESFYSKVCDSKEVKDSGAEGIVENDTEGVTEESLNEAIRKVGDSETMRIFGKDYKKGDTLVDSDGVKARIMYRDGNDAVVLTEEDNKWYRLPIKDAMDPNEDKDENIHVNWKISDLEKYLRKPASMRRGKKVEDSESVDKKALGEWLVKSAQDALNTAELGTVYYKDLGDGHSVVLAWVTGNDGDEGNPFTQSEYGLEASIRDTKSSYFVDDWAYSFDDGGFQLTQSDIDDGGASAANHLLAYREKVEDSKELPRRDFVFPADSTMVNDGKGHFPLNSLNRGRAALAFVARYDKLPKWYSGDMSLEEFKDHVRSEVKKAYPSIEVSDSVESGSGSFDFNEVYHDLDVALQKTRQYLIGKESESMTDADWDIATVGSAISRAMRYLHEAARKQGQTTDYTNVKDDCKVYDAKESTEDMWARICEADEITEREINLLNRRLNAEGRDTLDYNLRKNNYDLALTDEQERKALAWLNNQWKTSTGKERKNNPFGYREEQILDNATDVTFVEFYNAGNRYVDYFIPVYRVYSNDGSFEYYVQGGEVNIVG